MATHSQARLDQARHSTAFYTPPTILELVISSRSSSSGNSSRPHQAATSPPGTRRAWMPRHEAQHARRATVHPITSSLRWLMRTRAPSHPSVLSVLSLLWQNGAELNTGRAVQLLLLLFYVLGQHCGKQASSRLKTRPRRWHH